MPTEKMPVTSPDDVSDILRERRDRENAAKDALLRREAEKERWSGSKGIFIVSALIAMGNPSQMHSPHERPASISLNMPPSWNLLPRADRSVVQSPILIDKDAEAVFRATVRDALTINSKAIEEISRLKSLIADMNHSDLDIQISWREKAGKSTHGYLITSYEGKQYTINGDEGLLFDCRSIADILMKPSNVIRKLVGNLPTHITLEDRVDSDILAILWISLGVASSDEKGDFNLIGKALDLVKIFDNVIDFPLAGFKPSSSRRTASA